MVDIYNVSEHNEKLIIIAPKRKTKHNNNFLAVRDICCLHIIGIPKHTTQIIRNERRKTKIDFRQAYAVHPQYCFSLWMFRNPCYYHHHAVSIIRYRFGRSRIIIIICLHPWNAIHSIIVFFSFSLFYFLFFSSFLLSLTLSVSPGIWSKSYYFIFIIIFLQRFPPNRTIKYSDSTFLSSQILMCTFGMQP